MICAKPRSHYRTGTNTRIFDFITYFACKIKSCQNQNLCFKSFNSYSDKGFRKDLQSILASSVTSWSNLAQISQYWVTIKYVFLSMEQVRIILHTLLQRTAPFGFTSVSSLRTESFPVGKPRSKSFDSPSWAPARWPRRWPRCGWPSSCCGCAMSPNTLCLWPSTSTCSPSAWLSSFSSFAITFAEYSSSFVNMIGKMVRDEFQFFVFWFQNFGCQYHFRQQLPPHTVGFME